jgi:very-short-patch-repair endonuclease
MSRTSPRDAVLEAAARQDGVVSRQQATALGLDRWAVAHEIELGRWRAHGLHCIAVHRLELGDAARRRVAQWEAGDSAVLDGATSLQVAGLKNWNERIHLICPWPNGGRSWDGSFVHNSRLWNLDDFVVTDGVRRTRNDVATVRAAMYARSDRAAATVMAMSVQQGLTTGDRVLLEARRVNRHKRRTLILDIALQIADGAQALGELDFGRLCRQRGLPEPNRQVVRRGPRGRVYLDVYWDEFKVVIEIEGVHHDAPENTIDDCLRQNALTIARDSVLRIPYLGLRTCTDQFMDQVEQVLVVAGWRRAA